MSKSTAIAIPFLGPMTAAQLAAAPGPTAPLGPVYTYVDEFDASYRWTPGSTIAPDGFRVITHTGGAAGRWILDGDKITLTARGGVLDDWARVGAAMAAMAGWGSIHFNNTGPLVPFRVDTKQVTPNFTELYLNGAYFVSTLVPNVPGVALDASVFYNNGGTPVGDTTTLAVAAVLGDTTVTVVSAAGLAIGDRINLREGVMRRCAREIVDIVGNVVTLDRPVLRPYSIGAGVAVLPTCRDIIIHGSGANVSGTGDCVVKFISGWDCLVEDVHANVTMNFYTFSFDVAGRDCRFVRCTVDGNTTTPNGMNIFNTETCAIEDCYATRCASVGAFMGGSDLGIIRGGWYGNSGEYGIIVTVDDVTSGDTLGCRDCVIDGVSIETAALYGILISDGSSRTQVLNTAISNCDVGVYLGIGASLNIGNDNLIDGGSVRDCPNGAVFNAMTGSRGNRVINQVAVNNGSDPAGHVYTVTTGCVMAVDGCQIYDSGQLGNTKGMLYATGAGAILQVANTYGKNTGVGGNYRTFLEVNGSARAEVNGGCLFEPSSANTLGIYVSNGKAIVSGYRQTGGSDGMAMDNAASSIRVLDHVDVSACTSPFTAFGAGTYNRGRIALTAAAPLAIPFIGTNKTDRLFWSYETDVGATGVVITGAPIIGVGFSIVGLAGDTSMINYEIR